jgi:hypothetical protein
MWAPYVAPTVFGGMRTLDRLSDSSLIATGDRVFLCRRLLPLDFEKLTAVRSILRPEMPNEALYGGLARAGPTENPARPPEV